MNTVTVITGPVAAPSSVRRKPRLAVRGKNRKQVRDLRAKLMNVVKMDDREDWRAAIQQYTPYLFKVSENSKVAKAIATLLERCDQVLNERL